MPSLDVDRAVVVGAGLAGLAAATYLARAGYRVTVLERTPEVGGRVHEVRRAGCRFDAGPTILLARDLVAQVVAELGGDLDSQLPLVRVDPAYRYFFQDGTFLELGVSPEAQADAVEAVEPGAGRQWLAFLRAAREHYRQTRRHFLDRQVPRIGGLPDPRLLQVLFRMHAFDHLARHVGRYFRDPRLRAAFSFQSMYVGMSPFVAPAAFSLIPYLEHGEGVYYPRGGFGRLVEVLADLARRAGVRFEVETPVSGIEVRRGRAVGVRLADGIRPADVVVANADPEQVTRLLPPGAHRRRQRRFHWSSSAVVALWRVEGPPSGALAHHNAVLADRRFEASFASIQSGAAPDVPSFYVAAPSRTDPTASLAGAEGWTVLAPVGHLQGPGTASPDPAPRLLAQIQARIARIDPALTPDRIRPLAELGPRLYRARWRLSRGSAFGIDHRLSQVGPFRPGPLHPSVAGLYLCGASTHPGSGIPNVLLSGKAAATAVLRQRRRRRWPGARRRG